jgi:hypothetical protein
MALYPDGYKLVTDNGNAGQTGSMRIDNLAPGTYYWSVQSIDQAFEGSAFSTEQSFTITATGLNEGALDAAWKVWPIPAKDNLNIESTGNLQIMEVFIYDLSGRIVLMEKPGSLSARLDISELNIGIYNLSVQVSDYRYTTIFIKH